MMSVSEDYIIENGVLRLYTGTEIEVTLPQNVVSVGPDAFRECSCIERVKLPEGLTTIGRGAFWGCDRLQSISFPSSLRSVGAWGFYGCRRLESAILAEGLSGLGENVFRNCNALREVRLPDTLERIPGSAFEGCTTLSRLRLPGKLLEIGSSAFRGCTSLRSLNLPETLVSLDQRAFWDCSALETIEFDDALEHIGSDAFYYCTALKEVSLPVSLASLGRCAFYGCAALEKVIFSAHTAEIGRYAFFKTPWWDAQPDGCVMAGAALYQYKGHLPAHAVLELPGETAAIAEYAFSGCIDLESVFIPRGVVSVGDCAFEDCTGLRSVTLPETLRSIGSKAFLRCIGLKKLTLPDQLSDIGDEAFKGCARLEDLSLPGALHVIGDGAFSGCDSLRRFSTTDDAAFFLARDGVLFSRSGKELSLYPAGRPERIYTVPEGVETICPGAFTGAYRLKTVFLPNTLTSLAPGTFTSTGLEYVRLPRGMGRISPSVFRSETYIGFYFPELAEKIDRPVFLGGGIQLVSSKRRGAALLGFLSALEHGETIVDRWRDSYIEYIRQNEAACARIAGKNETLLHLMMEEHLLSKRSTDELLSGAIAADRTDLTAELLAYQRHTFPPQPGVAFSLDGEDSPTPSGMDISQRRQALLHRVGIEGLVFSAVGSLRKFGYYSPLGTVDYSDLRLFIKKRGGMFQTVIDESVDAVICSEPKKSGEKLLSASRLGIPIISEAEFLQIASEQPRKKYTY